MRVIFTLIISLVLFGCDSGMANVKNFKTGEFKTYLDDIDATSHAFRDDSLQIEIYKGVKDTFLIKWNSNFEYELIHASPKSKLDSTPFIVKITGVKNNSYKFTAHYKGSNYKQKGRVEKIN
ncbi:MAG: DNA topoisomerase IV [Flavobacteriales bacterium]|nr:MAG: DNA topoisomerase IV [Flavobacteriales bacterium]